VVLDLEEGGRKIRFAFSGDIGRGHSDILRDPEHPQGVDVLMMESTYGNREHEPMGNVNDRVCAIVQRTLERRGKLIIPSFAVGRTQQLLYTLHQLIEQRRIPPLPTFVDSPLSTNATEVFRRHTECFNDKFRAEMNDPENPFHMANVTFTASVQESMAINNLKEPCIIISASGMAEAGRILHHLKNNIGDTRNTILIVGWCAQHTLGARLASGDKLVNIFGEPHNVRAQVETINAFSGHADHTELLAWAKGVSGSLGKIFIVHGEEPAATTFAADLRQMHPQANVLVPEFQDSVEL
jgi:metallo-beta-lactamase family protein